MHTYTHAHTRTHARTHAHTHARTHTRTRTHTHVHTHACTSTVVFSPSTPVPECAAVGVVVVVKPDDTRSHQVVLDASDGDFVFQLAITRDGEVTLDVGDSAQAAFLASPANVATSDKFLVLGVQLTSEGVTLSVDLDEYFSDAWQDGLRPSSRDLFIATDIARRQQFAGLIDELLILQVRLCVCLCVCVCVSVSVCVSVTCTIVLVLARMTDSHHALPTCDRYSSRHRRRAERRRCWRRFARRSRRPRQAATAALCPVAASSSSLPPAPLSSVQHLQPSSLCT